MPLKTTNITYHAVLDRSNNKQIGGAYLDDRSVPYAGAGGRISVYARIATTVQGVKTAIVAHVSLAIIISL